MAKSKVLFVSALTIGVALGATQMFLDNPLVIARGHADGGRYLDIVSTTYDLDQVYLSMQGPRGNQPRMTLDLDARPDETLWLTGIETINVDADTGTRLSDEFFCHSNLTFCPQSTTPEEHNAAFEQQKHMEWRLFTLVPGRMQMNLPDGFGIPIKGATQVDYFTMALNQNPGSERRIRMKSRVYYRRDHEADVMRPLFRRGLYVYQQHTLSDVGVEKVDRRDQHEGEHCAESCELDLASEIASTFEAVQTGTGLDQHPGATCCVVNASKDGVTEQFGADNTVHWMVPPGKHQYRTNVTKQIQLPFDTTVHYVTGHLHPYGQSLSMVDLESGETVFKITAEDYTDRKGVKRMSEIQSSEGIPIRHNGRYELIAEYNNTTSADIDAMGILYLYALDTEESAVPFIMCGTPPDA